MLLPQRRFALVAVFCLLGMIASCSRTPSVNTAEAVKLTQRDGVFRAETASLALEWTSALHFRVFLNREGKWVTLSPEQDLLPITSLRLGAQSVDGWNISAPPSVEHGVSTPFGQASRISMDARDSTGQVGITLRLTVPADLAGVVIAESSLTNVRQADPIELAEVDQASLRVRPGTSPAPQKGVLFWSLQGGGYAWGRDYILPVSAGFSQDNYTGPKGEKGNGGGTPLVDLWRPEMGLAVALLAPKPALAWVPVDVDAQGTTVMKVVTKPSLRLAPGESYTPPPVMIVAHRGDFYDPVVRYRELMARLGVRVVQDYLPGDYAPAWCTWGFERKFTVPGILTKLPQMKAMGIKEFILDDGWFDRFGDWQPTRQKFPRGEADLENLIDQVHAAGMSFRLWWSPGSADPGSEADRQHPDWYILDKAGRREKASWNAYYLCPAYAPVRQYTRQLVERFVKGWSVDSFKIDGTSLNHAPLCYNPAHHHARPEESFEQWPDLFGEIRATARQIRKDFRIELCPCGITPTFQLAETFEQPTDSDPFDYQVTARVKFLKAMFGPRSPVLQEYVGLSASENLYGKEHPFRVDLFPRAMGTGEVPSTFSTTLRDVHARWFALYNQHRPAEGEYLNLYDIRWETPEGHAIRKGDKLYYGFFTQTPGDKFIGTIELRGLAAHRYRVTDYVANRVVGEASGPTASLPADFRDSLLLVAEPISPL